MARKESEDRSRRVRRTHLELAELGRLAGERHLARAREQIEALPQRREEPDLDRFEALVLTWRDRPDDRLSAEALLERAVAGYRSMGMPRHAREAATGFDA